MAYNRRNILKRIIDIQNVTLEHTKRGVTQEWVYNNIVFPTYRISRSCYYAYLNINAKSELKKLDENASKKLEDLMTNEDSAIDMFKAMGIKK